MKRDDSIYVRREAAKRLSPELRQMNADIPWQDVAGMRDKLIHGYFGVEISQIWLTVTNDVPALKAKILTIASGRS